MVTEEELRDHPKVKEMGNIRLGFNCLGGKPTLPLIRNLGRSGILVSYGAMTRQPIPVPVGPLIFKDIQLRGFWVSGTTKRPEFLPQRLKMLDEITNMMVKGDVRLPPYDSYPHTEWKQSIEKSLFKDDVPKALPRKTLLSLPKAN